MCVCITVLQPPGWDCVQVKSNLAHNIHFLFQAEDSQATPLSHALRVFAEKLSTVPDRLILEYFSSMNFIGQFVSENCAAFLKQVTADFAEEAKKLGQLQSRVCSIVRWRARESRSNRIAFCSDFSHSYEMNSELTFWGLNKMASILKMINLNAFSWMKLFEF